MPDTPMIRTLNITAARSQLGQLVNSVFKRHSRVVIEKSGIPVAVIISTEDADRLTRLERQSREDFSVLDEVRDAFADIPEAELEAQIERALKEVRARADRKEPEAAAEHG